MLQYLNTCAKRSSKPPSGTVILLAVQQLCKVQQEMLQAVKYSLPLYSSVDLCFWKFIRLFWQNSCTTL